MGGRIDRETILRQLKDWIRRREGQEVEIVAAHDVMDMNGDPASLNVIVSTHLDGRVTPQHLKAQLGEAAERERALRQQLAKAKQEEDVAGVNRLAAEWVAARTSLVESNGVSSYKVGLRKDQPPVLSFWQGLPFETVREEAARTLAMAKIGPEAGLRGLVHYTSAAALLQFTNRAGATVYVDPLRMAEVPPSALRGLGQGPPPSADGGRDARIAAQWEEYLQSGNTNPPKNP